MKNSIKKLDKIFSEYIRLKHSSDGYCECITCGNSFKYKEIDNGHFIGRKHLSLRFDEMNCHPQCVECNRFKDGEEEAYKRAVINKYGIQGYDYLMKKKHETSRLKKIDIDMMIEYYSNKIKTGDFT